MKLTLHGARLIDARGEKTESALSIEDGRITSVGAKQADSGKALDISSTILMPGFIDVHTHGGGGYDLQTTNPEDILAYARWAPSTGVTSFLIGVVGTPGGPPIQQLRTAVTAIRQWREGAEPLGIHMEGPYINVVRRGAHDPSWLRFPNEDETARILEAAGGYLRLVTIAPELEGAEAMIRTLRDAGVTVSIGHTDCTYEQAKRAISLGITHATHCYNAMRSIHHRAPGPLGAIVEAEQVRGELIADGVHVQPAAMRILVRALGPERTVVITDALSAAGVPDATFTFNGRPARVIDGVARLEDGTITGSVLTMDQALRNLTEMVDASLPEASGMLSLNPASDVKASDRKGLIEPGYDADLCVFDEKLNLLAAFRGGEQTFAARGWRQQITGTVSS